MTLTPPPERPDLTPPARRPLLAIALAAVVFGMAALALIFLSNFLFLPIFIMGGVVVGIAIFHYLLWGWWLGRMIREEGDEE